MLNLALSNISKLSKTFKKIIGNNVLVDPDPLLGKTKAGLLVPTNSQPVPRHGKVVQVGEEVKNVKVGDSVFFKRYAGFTIDQGDKEYYMMTEDEILAKEV